jgi:hypothetical protein
MKIVLFALVCAAGCIVGDSGPGGGGDSTGGGNGDGTGGGMGDGAGGGMAQPDGGTGAPACTNAVYDPCTSPDQCTSGNCQLFQQAGIQVCTQTCTPGDATTCPQQDGQPASCNNMGICRPLAANTCTR